MAGGRAIAPNATNYNVSSTCATVPGIAQLVPSLADFLAALQARRSSPFPRIIPLRHCCWWYT